MSQAQTIEIREWGRESNIPIYETNKNPINFSNNPPQIHVEAVDGVNGAAVLHNVLTDDECQQFIQITEQMGYADGSCALLFADMTSTYLRWHWCDGDDA
jgi:hypothetical protein